MNNTAANYYATLSTSALNDAVTRLAGRVALGEAVGGTRGIVAALSSVLALRIGPESAGRVDATAVLARLDRVTCMLG